MEDVEVVVEVVMSTSFENELARFRVVPVVGCTDSIRSGRASSLG